LIQNSEAEHKNIEITRYVIERHNEAEHKNIENIENIEILKNIEKY
jgi:hypothetical protein